MTLDQLAAASGVDRGTISRIELGHVSPRIDTISFLCEAMGTRLDLFFDQPDPEQPDPAKPDPEPSQAGPAPGRESALPFLPRPGADGDGYWPVPSSFWQGLLEVMDRFEALLKNSNELILVLDRTGTILYASPSSEPVLGLRAADLLGRTGHTLVHAADRERFQRLLTAIQPVANGTGRLDYRLAHRDGSWRWVSSRFCNLTGNPHVQAVVINSLEIPGNGTA